MAQNFLELPSTIPSHDTFSRVFSLIKPESLQEEAFKEFSEREIIALDGKFLNGSMKENGNSRSSLLMVSAWARNQDLLLDNYHHV